MKIYLLGPPGAGKTAVSPILRERYGICHINSTDVLRDAITSGSDIGIHVKQQLDAGKPVCDSTLADLVADRAKQPDCTKGFVLDGLPRTEKQAVALGRHPKLHPDAVVVLNVPDEAVISRISGRWLHRPSGRTYHDIYCPPKTSKVDDVTGEPLEQRADDKLSVITARMNRYRVDIDEVLPFLRTGNASGSSSSTTDQKKGRVAPMIVQVQADQSIGEVWKSVFAVLDQVRNAEKGSGPRKAWYKFW